MVLVPSHCGRHWDRSDVKVACYLFFAQDPEFHRRWNDSGELSLRCFTARKVDRKQRPLLTKDNNNEVLRTRQ